MIRELELRDAQMYLELMRTLDHESDFMLLEPDERDLSLAKAEAYLKQKIEGQVSSLFVAEEDGQLVGFVEVSGERLKRIRHRAMLVIGIREAYQGRGLGKQLMARAIEWAKMSELKRLELTVISRNKQALWLYSRMGFSVEGTRRKAMYIKNEYWDEFYMSLLLM